MNEDLKKHFETVRRGLEEYAEGVDMYAGKNALTAIEAECVRLTDALQAEQWAHADTKKTAAERFTRVLGERDQAREEVGHLGDALDAQAATLKRAYAERDQARKELAMMTNLRDRAREEVGQWQKSAHSWKAEASVLADERDALQAEVERLKCVARDNARWVGEEQARVRTLTDEVNALRKEVEHLRECNERQAERLGEERKERDRAREEVERLREDLCDETSMAGRLEMQASEALTERDALRERLAELERELGAMHRAKANAAYLVKAAEAECDALRERLADLQCDHEAEVREHAALQGAADALKAEVESVARDRARWREVAETLRARLERVEAEFREVNTERVQAIADRLMMRERLARARGLATTTSVDPAELRTVLGRIYIALSDDPAPEPHCPECENTIRGPHVCNPAPEPQGCVCPDPAIHAALAAPAAPDPSKCRPPEPQGEPTCRCGRYSLERGAVRTYSTHGPRRCMMDAPAPEPQDVSHPTWAAIGRVGAARAQAAQPEPQGESGEVPRGPEEVVRELLNNVWNADDDDTDVEQALGALDELVRQRDAVQARCHEYAKRLNALDDARAEALEEAARVVRTKMADAAFDDAEADQVSGWILALRAKAREGKGGAR